MDWFYYEKEAAARGFCAVCGIDEAGRGPLAGPVYAAAVILPPDCVIEGLNDSKKLTEARREKLFDVIVEKAVAYGIGSADEKEIDSLNILQATYLAMQRAVEALPVPCDYAMVDGNRMPPLPVPGETIVKGDAKSASIAAASILAKVSRDRVMMQYHEQYPAYGFNAHKGYGTRTHYAALEAYGPCPIHRLTFLKKFFQQQAERKA